MAKQFSNTHEMKVYVKGILESKNIQKLPRTLAGRMDDYTSAEFFGLSEKCEKYHNAIVNFCNALQSRDFKNLPEVMKSDEWDSDTLKAKALIHARRVRELSELRARLAEKQAEVNNSEGRVPPSQRERFGQLLVELQNVIAESA